MWLVILRIVCLLAIVGVEMLILDHVYNKGYTTAFDHIAISISKDPAWWDKFVSDIKKCEVLFSDEGVNNEDDGGE